MITIPVLINFDNSNPIGHMEIDETKLPFSPKFCFSLGIKILSVNAFNKVDKYELVCVSMQHDSLYKEFLESEQYGKF